MPTAPSAANVARTAPSSKAAAAGGSPATDFASDLARLVALLGAGMQDAAPPASGASADGAPTADPDEADPLGALCAEVGLVVPGVAAPIVAPPPSSTGDAAPADGASALTLSNGSARPAHGSPAALPPAAPLTETGRQGASADALDAATVPSLLGAAQATGDAGTADAIVAAAKSDSAPAQPALPGVPVEMLSARQAPGAPSPIAATVVDALQPQAPRQMAETVAWHVPVHGAAEVQIRINPEELGPVDVQLKLDGDKVSVRFDLADERVRDVVQSSLPSLSSMLSSRGLQLDQAQVFSQQRGQGSPQQQAQPQAAWSSARHDAGDDGNGISMTTAAPRLLMRRGLLDDYA